MYDNDRPVGYVGIRTEINEDWKKWCGNVYYCIRLSDRGKGYGNAILNLAKPLCKKIGVQPIYIQANIDNILSQKVIEHNGGVEYKTDKSKYYYIDIK